MSKDLKLQQYQSDQENKFVDDENFANIDCKQFEHNQQPVISICTYEFCSEKSREMCYQCQEKVHNDHSNEKNRWSLAKGLNAQLNKQKEVQQKIQSTLNFQINSIIDSHFKNHFEQYYLVNSSKEQVYEHLCTPYNKYFFQMISNVMDKIDSKFIEILNYNTQKVKFLPTIHNTQILQVNEYQVKSNSEKMVLIEMLYDLKKETKFELRLKDNQENNYDLNKNCFLGFIDKYIANNNQMRFEELQGPYQIMHFYGVLETQGKQWTDQIFERFSQPDEDLSFTYHNNELTIQTVENYQTTKYELVFWNNGENDCKYCSSLLNQYQNMKKTGSQIQSQKIVCQFHPPALGIVYKQGDKKTKLYKIQFNEMIQINDAEKITQLLFRNYYLHINEESVPYEQLFNAVALILSKQFLNQKSSSLSFSQKRQSPFTYSNDCLDEDLELI